VAPVPVAALGVGILLRSPEAGVGAALVVLLVVAVIWRAARQPAA
jgi:hypothetical protein